MSSGSVRGVDGAAAAYWAASATQVAVPGEKKPEATREFLRTRAQDAHSKAATLHLSGKAEGAQQSQPLVETYAKFIVNRDTNQVSVRIINAATNEVIREIPPEELARVAEGLKGYQKTLAEKRGLG